MGMILAACDNTKPQVEETQNDTTAISKWLSIDSLLMGVVKASELELPILWDDIVYDTCQTHFSSDGKYIAFIGKTEEDAIRNSQYGIGDNSKEALFNSLFLYDNECKTMLLVVTASPTIGALSEPQIDSKHGWLYYLREDIFNSKGFFRYDIKSQEVNCLTGSGKYLTYSLKPNGNILFHSVREDVCVWDISVFGDEEGVDIGWQGWIYCDIEMTPSGICVSKSKFYTYDYYEGEITNIDFDVEYMGLITNISLSHKWNDSLRETQYFNRKGECVGITSNAVESYDGWNELKEKK